MNVSMKMWIDAYRHAPDTTKIKKYEEKAVLTMSPGRIKILNAYRAGLTKVKDLEKVTKMSSSFIGVTLRRFVETGMIKRETNFDRMDVKGKIQRKAICLGLIESGSKDITSIMESMELSRAAVCRYLLELRDDGKVVYIPGKMNEAAVIIFKEAA